jgi:hypothetical protein
MRVIKLDNIVNNPEKKSGKMKIRKVATTWIPRFSLISSSPRLHSSRSIPAANFHEIFCFKFYNAFPNAKSGCEPSIQCRIASRNEA